ncbi:unnamed protein product [Trifolium pratense]|uniref:Uncharacterized protein n=1 Tax=Trifolium pratense TaxID=57577 RepID=A0ACB0JYQ1_TRIPR|nr:unnamed protein product [Trifolium pratense]
MDSYLWHSVPILNFLNTKVNGQQDIYRFNQFIDTNFPLLETSAASHSIHTFFLGVQYHRLVILSDLDHQISLTKIHNWIKHVVERNVQYLSLELHGNYTTHVYDFPTFLNLTHLVLYCDWDIVVCTSSPTLS